MTILLLVLAVFVGLLTVGAWRTIAVLTFSIYSTILLLVGFVVGGLWSWICFPKAVETWHLSESWVTKIVDSPDSGILQLFSIPFVFVGDLYRWMFEITLFQGNPFLWICMGLAVWKVARDAVRAYKSFTKGRQEMIDLRIRAGQGTAGHDSSMAKIAETTLTPGYDAAGNFVGFRDRHDAMRHGHY